MAVLSTAHPCTTCFPDDTYKVRMTPESSDTESPLLRRRAGLIKLHAKCF